METPAESPPVRLPKFYFNFHVWSLRFLGIEVLVKNESWQYRVYSFCMLFFTLSFAFIECLELAFHSDFNTIALVCNYAVSHFLGAIKVIVFYTNRKQIGDLLQSLHEGRFKPNQERGGSYEGRCIRTLLRETIFLMSLYAISIIIVYNLGLAKSLNTYLNLPQEQWMLPYCPIAWINTQRSPAFELVYIYTAVGIFMITLCVYTTDVTVVSVIAQIIAQLRILEHTVRNYQKRGIRYQAKQKGKSVVKSVEDALVESIEHHYNILDSVNTVEYLCSYLALCVFIANLILLCLLMYTSSLLEIPSLNFFMYFFYYFLIAIQVFLYCWTGNEMTLANEALALGIAESYNPYEPMAHAKALKLMMIRAQRPLCLTAGKFVPLSLEVYKAIIKGSFSYFMVLRQVNSE